jgi:hypothetical protein
VGWLACRIVTTNRLNYCVIFYYTHSLECGRGLHNTTWRALYGPQAAGWLPDVENVIDNKAACEEKFPYPSTDII